MSEAIRGAVAGAMGYAPDQVGVLLGDNLVIVAVQDAPEEWSRRSIVFTVQSIVGYGTPIVVLPSGVP